MYIAICTIAMPVDYASKFIPVDNNKTITSLIFLWKIITLFHTIGGILVIIILSQVNIEQKVYTFLNIFSLIQKIYKKIKTIQNCLNIFNAILPGILFLVYNYFQNIFSHIKKI